MTEIPEENRALEEDVPREIAPVDIPEIQLPTPPAPNDGSALRRQTNMELMPQ